MAYLVLEVNFYAIVAKGVATDLQTTLVDFLFTLEANLALEEKLLLSLSQPIVQLTDLVFFPRGVNIGPDLVIDLLELLDEPPLPLDEVSESPSAVLALLH